MSGLNKAERLAEEREARRQAEIAAREDADETLDPPWPYRVVPFDPDFFAAMIDEEQEP
ncbi:MAG: hypothetical protein AB7I98_03930 [Verrucomicrobiales bacterium]